MLVATLGLIIGFLGILGMLYLTGWDRNLPEKYDRWAISTFLGLIIGCSLWGFWCLLNYCIYITQHFIKIDF